MQRHHRHHHQVATILPPPPPPTHHHHCYQSQQHQPKLRLTLSEILLRPTQLSSPTSHLAGTSSVSCKSRKSTSSSPVIPEGIPTTQHPSLAPPPTFHPNGRKPQRTPAAYSISISLIFFSCVVPDPRQVDGTSSMALTLEMQRTARIHFHRRYSRHRRPGKDRQSHPQPAAPVVITTALLRSAAK